MSEKGDERTSPSMNQYAFRVRFDPLPSPSSPPMVADDEVDKRTDYHDHGSLYLIITNISKKANIKALIAAAAAHRFTPVLVGEPNITELDCCLVKPGNNNNNANNKTTNNVLRSTTATTTAITVSTSVPTVISPSPDVVFETTSVVDRGAFDRGAMKVGPDHTCITAGLTTVHSYDTSESIPDVLINESIPDNTCVSIPEIKETIPDTCECIRVLRCATMDLLVAYLSARDVPLVGIEIMDCARSIMADDAFPVNTTLPTANGASKSGSSATFPTALPAANATGKIGSSTTADTDSYTSESNLEEFSNSQSSNPQSNHAPLPPSPRIAFMPGNEGTGLSTAHKTMCKGQFVYIPHYGAGDVNEPTPLSLLFLTLLGI